MVAAVGTARRSCGKAGKAQNIHVVSGFIWGMSVKYSDESGEKAKNSWARRAPTVVLINIAVLASLLFAMEVGFRLFRPGYEFYSRTQPGQFEDRTFRAGRFRK